jgi:tripartite-type tricarboxylate transporter receptor subunit TctC
MSMAHAGTSPEGSTGASFEKTIASDLEQWREVVNTNKITLQ